MIRGVRTNPSGRIRKATARVTQPITPCCQVPGPPSPQIKYDVSSYSSKLMSGKGLQRSASSLLCRMAQSQESQLREEPCSLLHGKAKQTQGLPFSHSKRRGRMAGWVWAPSPPQALPHQVTQAPLPEPTCTPLAAVGCARAISAGLGSSCQSGRQWLDHTHYICVSVICNWCQLVACGVDPISKAPAVGCSRGEQYVLPVRGGFGGGMHVYC